MLSRCLQIDGARQAMFVMFVGVGKRMCHFLLYQTETIVTFPLALNDHSRRVNIFCSCSAIHGDNQGLESWTGPAWTLESHQAV